MSTLWIERVTSWVFIKVPPWFPACQRKRAGPLTLGWSPGFAARVWVWGQGGGCPARSTVNKIQPTRSTSRFGQDNWLPNLGFVVKCAGCQVILILIEVGVNLGSNLQCGGDGKYPILQVGGSTKIRELKTHPRPKTCCRAIPIFVCWRTPIL